MHKVYKMCEQVLISIFISGKMTLTGVERNTKQLFSSLSLQVVSMEVSAHVMSQRNL
jgi:TATA-box binding protein (TBP) (component of TFIID and TFIIIB)